MSSSSNNTYRLLGKSGIVVTQYSVSGTGRPVLRPIRQAQKRKESKAYRHFEVECALTEEILNRGERLRRHRYDARKEEVRGSALAEQLNKSGVPSVYFILLVLLDTITNYGSLNKNTQNAGKTLNRSVTNFPPENVAYLAQCCPPRA